MTQATGQFSLSVISKKKLLVFAGIFLLILVLAWKLFFSLSSGVLDHTARYFLADFNNKFKGSIAYDSLKTDADGLTIENIVLKDENGLSAATVKCLTVKLNIRQALLSGVPANAIGSIKIDQPYVKLLIDQQGRFNMATFGMKKPQPKKPPFDVNKYFGDFSGSFAITDGTVYFEDLSQGEFIYQLDDWNLKLQGCPGQKAAFSTTFTPHNFPSDSVHSPAQIVLNGHILPDTKPDFDVKLSIKDLDLVPLAMHPLCRRFCSLHSGQLNSELWATCAAPNWSETLNKLQYGGLVVVNGGQVMVGSITEAISDIGLVIKITPGLFLLEKAAASVADTLITASGRLFLVSDNWGHLVGQSALTLSASQLSLTRVGELIGKKIPVSGHLSFNVQASGNISEPEISARLSSPRLTAAGQNIDNVRLTAAYVGHVLTVEELSAQAVGGQVKGSGFVDFSNLQEPQIVFNVSGHDASLQSFSPVGGFISDFDASFVGSPKDPFIFGSGRNVCGFTGKAAMLENCSADFMYSDKTVTLINAQAETNMGSAVIPYATYDLANAFLYASASTSGFSIPNISLGTLGQLSGRASGRVLCYGNPSQIKTLSMHGYSDSCDLQLGSLSISGLHGSVGFQDMQLLIADMQGQAAGGNVCASGWVGLDGGSSNLYLAGQGVDISSFVSLLNVGLPVEVNGSGEVGLNWFSPGAHQENWLKVYAASPQNRLGTPYALALSGFFGSDRVGATAWTDGLQLVRRRLTDDLTLAGAFTGQMAVWGPSFADLQLAFGGALENSPLRQLKDQAIFAYGSGAYSQAQNRLSFERTALVWDYAGRETEAITQPALRGRSHPWFGTILSPALTRHGQLSSPLPSRGLIALEGWTKIGSPLDYRLAFDAAGIDLAWLAKQDWLPQAGNLLTNANIKSGLAMAGGTLFTDKHAPRLGLGSWIEVPWFMTKDSRYYSAVADLSMGASRKLVHDRTAEMGPLLIHRAAVSSRAYDARFPSGPAIAKEPSWQKLLLDDVVMASGSIDGAKINLQTSGHGWDVSRALAFVPQASGTQPLFNGEWSTDKLNIGLDMDKGILPSLALDGRVLFSSGFINLGERSLPIKSISADLHQSQGTLNITNFEANSGQITLCGRGQRDSNGLWHANLWADNLPFSTLRRFGPKFGRFEGQGRLAVSLNTHAPKFAKASAVLGFAGRDVIWRGNPVSMAFPTFRFGDIRDSGEGMLTTDESIGIKLTSENNRWVAEIPSGAVQITAYRILSEPLAQLQAKSASGSSTEEQDKNTETSSAQLAINLSAYPEGSELDQVAAMPNVTYIVDKVPTKFSAEGTAAFLPDFSSGASAWFTGASGPDFGISGEPFKVALENFKVNLLMSALGYNPTDKRFSFSGELGLKGQWYRGHLVNSPAGSLDYAFKISDWQFGRYLRDANGHYSGDLWQGMASAAPITGSYRREETSSRLVVNPYTFLPYKDALSKAELEDSSVTGSANIAIARLPWSVVQSRQKNGQVVKRDVNEIHLDMNNLQIGDLSSFLFPGDSYGRIRKFVFNASGPVLSPTFNMAFDIADSKFGPLETSLIQGGLSGSRDAVTKKYGIRLGTLVDSIPNQQVAAVVNSGLTAPNEADNSQTLLANLNAVRMYIGKDKREDRTFEISGTLPYEVERTRTNIEKSLVPFWAGVKPSLDGEIDLSAKLYDQGMGLLADIVPDVKKSDGLLQGQIHLGGTVKDPELQGSLDLTNGSVEHNKVGTLSNLNVKCNFNELDLASAYPQHITDDSQVKVSRLTIDRFDGKLGNAPFTVKGSADMFGFEPLAMDIGLNGQKLPLKWGELFSGDADVDLSLKAQPSRGSDGHFRLQPVLSGDVRVASGDLSLALDALSSQANGFDWRKIPLDYCVRLSLGNDVWVHALGSRVRAGGDLWVVPDVNTRRPVLAGSVDLSRGVLQIPLYEANFKVRSGQATFEDSLVPSLVDVQADTDIGNYHVMAIANGTYPDISVELMSNPPLSEKEIKRMLALGTVSNFKPSANISNFEQNSANDFTSSNLQVGTQGLAVLSRLLASPLTQEIGRIFFLSDFSFDVSPPYGYTIKIAKAIDANDKILFTLTRTMKSNSGKDESIYGIEWRFKPNFLTRMGFDQEGNWRPWFQGHWEF